MARLYADENFRRSVIDLLRELGHDVLTAFEGGQANQKIPDEEVLQFAHAEKRALITYNRRHFIRLHHTSPFHSGIIICTEDSNVAAFAGRIHDALFIEDLENQLIRVIRPNA